MAIRKNMKIIIVGAGDVGQTLANVLASKDHEISVIEMNEEIAKNLASTSEALILKGDATNIDIMKDADIEHADAVLAVTGDDKTNLMVCQIAKSSEVRRVIARVNDPKNDELFSKLGIYSAVSSVSSIVANIKKALYKYGDEKVVAVLGSGLIQIVEVSIEKTSRLVGTDACNLGIGAVCAVFRDGDAIVPTKSVMIKAGDVLVVSIGSRNIDKLLALAK